MNLKTRLVPGVDRIQAIDREWLTLGDLRELVRIADAHGWGDRSLVSHSSGGGDHPRLRSMLVATNITVEGPA